MSAKRKTSLWLGFDLGGTKMQAMLLDAKFKKLASKRKKTKGHEGMAAGLKRMTTTIQDALDEAGVSRKELAGIGVGCPGPLDIDRGVILDTPNLGWKRVPVRDTLEKEFGCPTHIINDVDAGTYGEYRFGAARKAHCAVGLFPGTGLGGGCVYDGKILRGKTGSCMEIGHMMIMPDGPRCGCGQRGCLEALVSRLAMASAAAAAAYRGEAPHLMEIAGTDVARIRSGVLAASIDAGDDAIERIVREASQWLGRGVANIINLLAPDVIVLGGGLVEAMPDLIAEEVESTARKHVMPSFQKSFKVAIAQLGDDATVNGAAAWAADLVEKG